MSKDRIAICLLRCERPHLMFCVAMWQVSDVFVMKLSRSLRRKMVVNERGLKSVGNILISIRVIVIILIHIANRMSSRILRNILYCYRI